MPKGKGKATVKAVMGKFSKGTLHSGSKKGPVVKSKGQALAIGIHESGARPRKVRSA